MVCMLHDIDSNNAPMQGKDLQRLWDFVLEHVPNVMLVATTGQYAEVLFSYVSALKDVVVSKNAQLLTSNSDSGRIDIKWADQSVAQAWENSTAAKEELTDQPVLVRRAVAIGRTAIYGQLPILCSLAGKISRETPCFTKMSCSWLTLYAECHDVCSTLPQPDLH